MEVKSAFYDWDSVTYFSNTSLYKFHMLSYDDSSAIISLIKIIRIRSTNKYYSGVYEHQIQCNTESRVHSHIPFS